MLLVLQTGQKMRADMSAKIEKWQEPPPAQTIKPLPKPDAEVKKRRGGRRLRKMKERYGLTDVRGWWCVWEGGQHICLSACLSVLLSFCLSVHLSAFVLLVCVC